MLLIMVFGEELVERGRLEKVRMPKTKDGKPTEFWPPNFLGRLYQSAVAVERENRGASTQRLHWRRGHIKSHLHRPRRELRKIICIQPYKARPRAGTDAMKQDATNNPALIEPIRALPVEEPPIGVNFHRSEEHLSHGKARPPRPDASKSTKGVRPTAKANPEFSRR